MQKINNFFLSIKQKFINLHQWIENNKEKISTYSAIILIVVTLVLIGVTINSTIVAKNLGKIQVNLQKFQEKKETNEQIKLAEDVKEELVDNRDKIITNILPRLEEMKNDEKSLIIINFETTKVKLALESVGFGNKDITNQLRRYIDSLIIIEKHLENVEEATDHRDLKVRNESIGSAIEQCKIVVHGVYSE